MNPSVNEPLATATRIGLVVSLVVLLAGCGIVSRIHRGEVLESPSTGDPDRDNWAVLVELTNADVLDTTTVFVGFNAADLSCEDGGRISPEDVPVGAEVRFERVGDGVDTSSPPAIRGTDLRIDCPPE